MGKKSAVRIVKESFVFATLFTLIIMLMDNLYSGASPAAHYVATFFASLLIYCGLLYLAERYLVSRAK